MTFSLNHSYKNNNSSNSLSKTNYTLLNSTSNDNKAVETSKIINSNLKNAKTGNTTERNKQKQAQSVANPLETFQSLTNYAENTDSKINYLSDALKVSFDKNDQKEKIAEIGSLMTEKANKAGDYSGLHKEISNNHTTKSKISRINNFNKKADLSAPSEKQIIETDANNLNDWDKLRSLSRNDLKNMITRTPKDEMVNVLYEVPKNQLVKSLRQISKEQKLEILQQSHFAEVLIREIPKPELIKSLPNNQQLLPKLMKISNTKNSKNTSQESITNANPVSTQTNITKGNKIASNKIKPMSRIISNSKDSMDISNLGDREQQRLKKSILTSISNNDLLRLNYEMGIGAKEIAKNIPNNILNKQLGDLNKPQCIEGFKILDQNQIMDNLKGFSSVKLAKVTMDVVDGIRIKDEYISNNDI